MGPYGDSRKWRKKVLALALVLAHYVGMTLRLLYETLVVLLVIVVGWQMIVKPVYRLVVRPRRKALNTLDDLTGPTTAGEELADAKRELADARARRQAAELLNEAQTPHTTQDK